MGSKRGVPKSAKHRAAISKALKGKKHSAEHCLHNGEAQKALWTSGSTPAMLSHLESLIIQLKTPNSELKLKHHKAQKEHSLKSWSCPSPNRIAHLNRINSDPDIRRKHHVKSPVYYGGVKFKSSWEADSAKFFDRYGLKWTYEPVTFHWGGRRWYTPDFYVSSPLHAFIEVKPLKRCKLKAIDNMLRMEERGFMLLFLTDNDLKAIRRLLA